MFLNNILQFFSQLFIKRGILVQYYSGCISTDDRFFSQEILGGGGEDLHFPGCPYQDREGQTNFLLSTHYFNSRRTT